MTEAKAQLSVRIDLPGGERLGPGKVELMRAIQDTGSVSAAARQIGMSYPRAMKLMDSLNTMFASPLVETFHGGAERGGARLTETGLEVLRLYGRLIQASRLSTEADLAALTALQAENDARP